VDDQRRAGADSAYVGADIDHVGGRQEYDEEAHGPQAVPVLDVAGQPLAGDVADPSACLLHPGHQRQHPERGPQLPVAELGAGLGVCRDARRVVVVGAGDQARAEDPEQVTQLVVLLASGFPPPSRLLWLAWRRNV
jgi:hypothetical protein